MSGIDMQPVASTRVLRSDQITLGDDALVLLGRGRPAEVDAAKSVVEIDEIALTPAIDEVAELRAQLEAAVAKLEEHAADARDKERDAYQRGLAAGRDEGKAAAQRDAQAHLKLLEDALGEAVTRWRHELARLEAASAGIAFAAVEHVLGNDKTSARNVRLALNRQLSQLREATVVEIRVSPADFPDAAELAELGKRSGQATTVTHDDALTKGQCRIRLGLGEMAIDLPQQLAALRQLLNGAAR